MHSAVVDYVKRWRTTDRLSIIELGSRDINGSARGLFPLAEWTGVDIVDGPMVDVVADAATWQPDEPADMVITCETLEHAQRWRDIVANAHEMLTDGGRIVITAAGPGRAPHSGLIEGPVQQGEWYENVAPDELRAVLVAAGFVQVEVSTLGFDVQATAVRRGA